MASFLRSAGDDGPLAESDFLICRWPNETALAIAETFYLDGAPLTRLRMEHIRSEWAAIAAYGRVQNVLLLALADHVSAASYERAMRYSQQQYGSDPRFLETLELARADLDETKARGLEDPLSAYATAIYFRSILAEQHVPAYFSDATAEDAMRPVAIVVGKAVRSLANVNAH